MYQKWRDPVLFVTRGKNQLIEDTFCFDLHLKQKYFFVGLENLFFLRLE